MNRNHINDIESLNELVTNHDEYVHHEQVNCNTGIITTESIYSGISEDDIHNAYSRSTEISASVGNQEVANISNDIDNPDIDAYDRSTDSSASVNKYISRSLSWLKFNKRILGMANDQAIPLFERLKYLSITESNLDEFNMVSLTKLLSWNNEDNQTPQGVVDYREYKIVKAEMADFIAEQRVVHNSLNDELRNNGFELIVDSEQLSKKEFKWANEYFKKKVMPMLSPIVYDNMRPFQLLRNSHKYIGVVIRGETKELFGTVAVPHMFDRLIEIESEGPNRKFILMENLIEMNLGEIYSAKKLIKSSTSIFRVIKSTTYEVEESNEIAVKVVERKLERNEHGDVMRIDICGDKNGKVRQSLKKLIMNDNTTYNKVDNIVDLSYCMEWMEVSLTKEQTLLFKYGVFNPKVSARLENVNLFDMIKKEDILIQHPYDPYQTVIDFINQAADDKDTVCIKQTLYRVSRGSPIVDALIRAARRGVSVTVVCEIKARFDEMNNIAMAREIEKAGGQVIYGVHDRKIHAKMCLVIKRTSKDNLKSYVHLGTGNYNEKTSKIYTDISYFTAKDGIVEDVAKVFNSITGCAELQLEKIFCSPNGIVDHLSSMIDTEITNAKAGIDAHIKIKVNGLTDRYMIDKLYEAADAGVKVTLIVRGMCCLIDTSKITVKSIVGRLLEHSRIYEFANGGHTKIFISSADLMERNLYSRVELLIPINGKCKKDIIDILDVYIKDESASVLNQGDYKQKPKTEYLETINKDNNIDIIETVDFGKKELSRHNVRVYSSQEYFIDVSSTIQKI